MLKPGCYSPTVFKGDSTGPERASEESLVLLNQ